MKRGNGEAGKRGNEENFPSSRLRFSLSPLLPFSEGLFPYQGNLSIISVSETPSPAPEKI